MASMDSLRKRFSDALEASDLYTAEQTCRTISHRLRMNKPNAGDVGCEVEAREVLREGTLALLDRNEIHSGTALALDLVQDIRADGVSYAAAETTLLEIDQRYDSADLGQEGLALRLRFLRACIELSAETSEPRKPRGDDHLNGLAGMCCCKLENFPAASKHYVLSDAPHEFATMLRQWAATGLASEADLFITRAVLELAQNGRLREAKVVYNDFAMHLGRGSTPLFNFSSMVLHVLGMRDSYPLFKTLCESYHTALQRDPTFERMLGKLGEVYYGVAPPQPAASGLQGMVSSMVNNLFSSTPSAGP